MREPAADPTVVAPASFGSTLPDQIPAIVVAHLVEVADARGWPVDDWLTAAGVRRSEIADATDLIEPAQAVSIITAATAVDPTLPLGFEVGELRPRIYSFGMLAIAIATADTARDALAVAMSLQHSGGILLDLSAHEDGDHVIITARHHPELPHRVAVFLSEEYVFSAVCLVRSVLRDNSFALTRAEFGYPAPVYADAYAEHLDCEIRFDAPVTRLIASAEILHSPMPGRDPSVHAAAVAACRRVVGEKSTGEPSGDDYRRAVEELLQRDLTRPLTMTGLARQLGISERTLRRRLDESGESFRSIFTRLRRDRATQLLAAGLAMRDVAAEVGFHDPREFRRAYRRWTDG
ncbi:helix-turn-helix transcriptional regulator [Gordonia shandongensis]|uniref:helix-turn-helix transcriptional regulator n=1 Tax=Gordonia shandongensis TaxID=376351 RepID=UPI0003FA4C72|nr:AraC family transcriptional regulator [Gordonia shandongensis]